MYTTNMFILNDVETALGGMGLANYVERHAGYGKTLDVEVRQLGKNGYAMKNRKPCRLKVQYSNVEGKMSSVTIYGTGACAQNLYRIMRNYGFYPNYIG